MENLFDQTTINGMTMRNRLVRSATWEGMCEQDGRPTEKLINWYRDLAQGGIGLIISGYTFVRPEGKQLPGKMGIHTDAFAANYKHLTRAVHDAAGTSASGERNPARTKINTPEKEAYNLDLALKVKTAVGCPVMVVGGFRSYEVAEKAIRDDGIEYISMARPLIREPGLANR